MRPVRWGILGAARIAAAIAKGIRATPGAELAAVASRDLARAQAFATEHGAARALGSYEALLADPAIDAVYIPVPTALHARWALAAAEAGKPALVEKPFAMTREQAAGVFAAFARRSLPVGEAMMWRFHPLTRRVAELVRSGAIGEPRLLRATFSVAIDDPQDIRWRAETGGGALLDLGCYCVGALRLLAGAEPDQVAASATMASGGVDAAFAGTLRFAGGALGHFSCGMRGAFDCSYDAIGSTGRLRVDRGGMVTWGGEEFLIERWSGDARHDERAAAADPYQLMVAAFGDAVRGVATYPVTAEDTLANLAVMDRLRAATHVSAGAAAR